MEQLLRAQWRAALGHGGAVRGARRTISIGSWPATANPAALPHRDPPRGRARNGRGPHATGRGDRHRGGAPGAVLPRRRVRPALDTNEADSAALARAVLSELEVPSRRGIRRRPRPGHTAPGADAGNHRPGHRNLRSRDGRGPGTNDTAVVLDADLAILAAEPSRYQACATGVRAEYAHVDDAPWRTGRTTVLRAFLERPAIYLTAPMQRQEHRARANLAAELSSLAAP